MTALSQPRLQVQAHSLQSAMTPEILGKTEDLELFARKMRRSIIKSLNMIKRMLEYINAATDEKEAEKIITMANELVVDATEVVS